LVIAALLNDKGCFESQMIDRRFARTVATVAELFVAFSVVSLSRLRGFFLFIETATSKLIRLDRIAIYRMLYRSRIT